LKRWLNHHLSPLPNSGEREGVRENPTVIVAETFQYDDFPIGSEQIRNGGSLPFNDSSQNSRPDPKSYEETERIRRVRERGEVDISIT
jgi:hypothetical protein